MRGGWIEEAKPQSKGYSRVKVRGCNAITSGVASSQKVFNYQTITRIELTPKADFIMIDNAIDQFEGEYRFLSNFYPCKINAFGLSFDNAEAAFQSQKCVSRAPEFEHLSASSAKRLGRSVS